MVRTQNSLKKRTELEELLLFQIHTLNLPSPKREFRFHPHRRWRADFAWPDKKLLVEVEGGIFTHGRHTRALGFAADCTKYNVASLAGYRVLRFCAPHIRSGTAINAIELALGNADDIIEWKKIKEAFNE